MASAAQIEAFAWWLSQDRDGRTVPSMVENRGIPTDTAKKWIAKFNAEISKVASEAVQVHLREYREQYEVLQSRTMGILPKLVDAAETNANLLHDMARSGVVVNPKLLAGTASALKTVYSLAESASGADVAKRRASQKPTSGAKGDGKLALPDLGAFFLADSVELEDESPLIASPENPPINDSGNENPVDPAAMPEK